MPGFQLTTARWEKQLQYCENKVQGLTLEDRWPEEIVSYSSASENNTFRACKAKLAFQELSLKDSNMIQPKKNETETRKVAMGLSEKTENTEKIWRKLLKSKWVMFYTI